MHFLILAVFSLGLSAHATDYFAGTEPSDYPRHTFYVSRLGDDTDGSAWKTAFHTIQQALNAIPDGKGGYRIIIRPDTYAEANLYPAHKGAIGAYNVLEADWDGSLGCDATGWAATASGEGFDPMVTMLSITCVSYLPFVPLKPPARA